MGQLLGFYAGDADAIGAAYEEESDGLADQDCVRASADFSLHVTPLDIDFLIEAIADRTGGTARSLEDSFTRLVGGDPQEASAPRRSRLGPNRGRRRRRPGRRPGGRMDETRRRGVWRDVRSLAGGGSSRRRTDPPVPPGDERAAGRHLHLELVSVFGLLSRRSRLD